MSTNGIDWDSIGGVFSITGSINSIIGAGAKADAEKYKLKSQGLNFEHQQDMAKINAKMLNMQARQVAKAYDRQFMTKTMASSIKTSRARTSFAARGIQMGVGSTADVFITDAVMKEIDKLTMNSNKVRAVEQMRTRGVQADIRGDMLGVSASNMFASASTISPILNMSSTLLTGAADFAKAGGYGWFDGKDKED